MSRPKRSSTSRRPRWTSRSTPTPRSRPMATAVRTARRMASGRHRGSKPTSTWSSRSTLPSPRAWRWQPPGRRPRRRQPSRAPGVECGEGTRSERFSRTHRRGFHAWRSCPLPGLGCVGCRRGGDAENHAKLSGIALLVRSGRRARRQAYPNRVCAGQTARMSAVDRISAASTAPETRDEFRKVRGGIQAIREHGCDADGRPRRKDVAAGRMADRVGPKDVGCPPAGWPACRPLTGASQGLNDGRPQGIRAERRCFVRGPPSGGIWKKHMAYPIRGRTV